MKKRLLSWSLTLLALAGSAMTAQKVSAQELTLDFTSQSNWDIPTTGTNTQLAPFTDGTTTIKLYSTSSYKLNSGYLLLGKANSYLELPAFTFDVEKIEVVGASGASGSVVQNLYVGDKTVSTETTGAKGTNTYEIDADYQAAGNVYKLMVTSAHNTQISKIFIYKKANVGVEKPAIHAEEETSFNPIQISITCATEGASIYYTTDGSEPSAESTLYSAPFDLTASATVKAIAIKGGEISSIASKSFTILENIANTLETAYTVSAAVALTSKEAATLSNENNKVYVSGSVKEITEISTEYGNATYVITDGEQDLTVFRGKYLEGAAFSDDNSGELVVGATVVVYGNLTLYGTTPELATNNQLVSIVAPASVAQAIDINIAPESGDIAEALANAQAAITDAANIVGNITINLAEGGSYTISASIVAPANVTINGNGATIDASALTSAFINYASVTGEKAKKDDDSDSDYTIVENVTVQGVKIAGLSQSFINNAAGKVLFNTVLVDNSVVEIKGSNAIFALGNGYPEDLKITNSTLWSNEGHTGFLFQSHGKAVDIKADNKTSWTIDKSTLYQIAVGKKANNTNTFKGKNYLVMTLTNSLLYNFGSSTGNEVNGWLFGQNSTSPTITYANNAYLNADGVVAGWTDETKSGSDQTGTSIAGTITFADAANGDLNGTFTYPFGTTAPESIGGDPRWTITIAEGEEVSGISNIAASVADGATFNLYGQRTNASFKGFGIKAGKVIFQK